MTSHMNFRTLLVDARQLVMVILLASACPSTNENPGAVLDGAVIVDASKLGSFGDHASDALGATGTGGSGGVDSGVQGAGGANGKVDAGGSSGPTLSANIDGAVVNFDFLKVRFEGGMLFVDGTRPKDFVGNTHATQSIHIFTEGQVPKTYKCGNLNTGITYTDEAKGQWNGWYSCTITLLSVGQVGEPVVGKFSGVLEDPPPNEKIKTLMSGMFSVIRDK